MNKLSQILAVCSVATLTLLPPTTNAAMYVVGDSYSANGTNGRIPGDYRFTNGNVWVENLAVAMNQPTPITSSAVPLTADETATNFARGGARAIPGSGTGGLTRPNGGSEQIDELKTYLDVNSLNVRSNDVFTIWLGGNDVIEPYQAGVPYIVTSAYIDAVVNEIERLVASAVDLGFESIVMPNAVAPEALPLYKGLPSPELKVMFAEDIAYLNTRMDERIADLQEAYPHVTFFTANWNSLLRLASHNPADYGFVNATSMVKAGADPATAMWFDGIHPSAVLHQFMADAVSTMNCHGRANQRCHRHLEARRVAE